jgi:hypothetical protein
LPENRYLGFWVLVVERSHSVMAVVQYMRVLRFTVRVREGRHSDRSVDSALIADLLVKRLSPAGFRLLGLCELSAQRTLVMLPVLCDVPNRHIGDGLLAVETGLMNHRQLPELFRIEGH